MKNRTIRILINILNIVLYSLVIFGIPCIIIIMFMVKHDVNVMNERFAEIIANSSAVTISDDSHAVTSYQEFTPNESTDSFTVTSYHEFTPDESTDSSTVTSYQEFTPNESTDISTNAPEAITFTASIANTKTLNEKKNFSSLDVFKSENDAFNNAKNLPDGRHVSILLNTNSEVKEISSKVSMFNPETDLFEDVGSCDFEISQQVNFNIPDYKYAGDDPYSGYNSDLINCVIVVTVITEDGTFYMGCSY